MTAPAPVGEVLAVHAWPKDNLTPQPVDDLVLDIGGAVGDRHFGVTMHSDVRQRWLYGEGTQIRNNRQVSIVDASELAEIAGKLGSGALAPGTIADNICITGISNLTALGFVHDMDFIKQISKKVTCLHEGSVLAEGTLDKVQNDERVIEVYLGR